MIHKAGAGPEPIPHKELTMKKLRDAIKFAISPEAKEAARGLGDKIREEVSQQNVHRVCGPDYPS
jgi:sterol 3beta-glucosyltransferase